MARATTKIADKPRICVRMLSSSIRKIGPLLAVGDRTPPEDGVFPKQKGPQRGPFFRRGRRALRVNRPEQDQPGGLAETARRERLLEERRALFELDAVLEQHVAEAGLIEDLHGRE